MRKYLLKEINQKLFFSLFFIMVALPFQISSTERKRENINAELPVDEQRDKLPRSFWVRLIIIELILIFVILTLFQYQWYKKVSKKNELSISRFT